MTTCAPSEYSDHFAHKHILSKLLGCIANIESEIMYDQLAYLHGLI